jgi:drug/metabolite transporter (DMT)-like permease
MIDTKDFLLLLHPAIAIILIYPLIGNVVSRAWQVRQRRLEILSGSKSKIPSVGQEHVKLGRWLSSSVVGLALLGMGHDLVLKIGEGQLWTKEPFRVGFVAAIFVATIASLVLLYRAKPKLWRAVFATLTGMGLILLGCQPEIFRRTDEWYVSHYYYGIIAALLMILSLATIQDIYQDKRNRWRTAHIILNSIALLFFIGQGLTGTRDLLEIPLSWQEPYVYKCDFINKSCP